MKIYPKEVEMLIEKYEKLSKLPWNIDTEKEHEFELVAYALKQVSIIKATNEIFHKEGNYDA